MFVKVMYIYCMLIIQKISTRLILKVTHTMGAMYAFQAVETQIDMLRIAWLVMPGYVAVPPNVTGRFY